ncbi:MAG: hypothetical protein IJF92_05225 [Bacilli bacterium]|nr:hypothetical protein [Bacilli bacterium]
MVYSLRKVKVPKTKRTKLKLNNLENLIGVSMPSRKKKFTALDININNININNKKMAYPIVSKKVKTLYEKLLFLLTELLVTDDESGETYMEALNQIERFRIQIKNKYRYFLKRKELEKMSKQLKLLQMEARTKSMEIRSSYELMNATGKSR